ncbi:MAG: hypothetical protein QOG77_3848 [Solirubrobacteraceae bacterium]|nr:hypothetical protein [Solirubrobacteraceae bacterium]
MIQHVSLECHRDDADAHRSFWSALGFTEVTPPESLRERSVWLQSGATQIHLLWADEPVVPPQGHVAVCVPDLDALAIEMEERTQHWGERRVYARAPGGHVVELFETPPG